MESFVSLLDRRVPLIILTPYGVKIKEIIELIVLNLELLNYGNIYTDHQYPSINMLTYNNLAFGSLILTDIPNYKLNGNVNPIYIVEWGIKKERIDEFIDWVDPVKPIILYPDIYPYCQLSKIKWNTKKNISNELDNFSVIYSDDMLDINSIRNRGIPIFNAIGCDINGEFDKWLLTKQGLLITDDIDLLSKISRNIPINLINLDSSNLISLIRNAHRHIYVYLDDNISNAYIRTCTSIINNNQNYYTMLCLDARRIIRNANTLCVN